MSKYNKLELENLIFNENLSYEAIGKMYGVTGNAIKKAAIRLGIELPIRRKINDSENFSKPNIVRSKIDKLTDEELIQIIENNYGWKDISSALGYTDYLNSDLKKKLYERCSKLGIELQLYKPSPLLSRTKGDLLSDRKNYQSYRSSVRKLAEKIYKDSGKPQKCAICGYDKHIEIAHIKAVSEFDDSATIAEINSINNLIALCPNHHWEYDNGLITI